MYYFWYTRVEWLSAGTDARRWSFPCSSELEACSEEPSARPRLARASAPGGTAPRGSAVRTARADSPEKRIYEGTCGTDAAKDRGSSVRTARCAPKRSRTCTGTLGASIAECACSSSTSPPTGNFTRERINGQACTMDILPRSSSFQNDARPSEQAGQFGYSWMGKKPSNSDDDRMEEKELVREQSVLVNVDSTCFGAVAATTAATSAPRRLIERHFPETIPPTEKKFNPVRQCVKCSRKKCVNGKRVRKETRYYCPECNVGLYACPKCERSYRHLHHMQRHCRYECGRPPRFQCPYCGMRSKQSNNVYKHIRAKHPGWKLEIVERKRSLDGDGAEGTRTVTALLQMLPLPWFEDKYPERSSRKSKVRFPCPRCRKSYTTKSAVTAHFKYDCGKPPRFECPYCGKLSKKKFNVQDHVRHKHPSKPVICNTLF